MNTFQPAQYGPVFEPLLAIDRNRSLGIGRPDAAARKSLQHATLATAFGDAHLVDLEMARCCLAGVWLLHDFLNESHAISQQIETSSGSFWHGVMHRREGDFSNAKYWFRQVGPHPVFDELWPQIAALASNGDAKRRGSSPRPVSSIPTPWSTPVRPRSAAATPGSASASSSRNGSCFSATASIAPSVRKACGAERSAVRCRSSSAHSRPIPRSRQ